MMEQKEKRLDRRSKYTRQMIRNAFLRVKRNKSYYALTVTDLCREAEISRGTFYLHYNNIAEVLEAVLDEALVQMNDLFVQLDLASEKKRCPAYPLCRFIREQVKYRCLFFDDSLTTVVINRVSEIYLPEFIRRIQKQTTLTAPQIESIFYFQINGCFALSKRYANFPKEEWDVMQCTIDDFLRAGFAEHIKP